MSQFVVCFLQAETEVVTKREYSEEGTTPMEPDDPGASVSTKVMSGCVMS